MVKYLSVDEVIALANNVAARLYLRIPSAEELRIALQDRHGSAQMLSDGKTQLWVDKLYIAYSRLDEPTVHYVYITAKHIEEEYRSYHMARSTRNNNVSLPVNINKEFIKALRKMTADKKSFVIYKSP